MPLTPVKPRIAHHTVFRLLHSSNDSLITDRNEALHRLAHLPGARLFIVQAESTIASANG